MAPTPKQAFVGAGANLGDRSTTLRDAVGQLQMSPGITALETSALLETDPVGIVDQPKFLNLVLGLETTLSPETLLQLLLEIEQRFGRVRRERWGPRTLDLDLLLFEGESRTTPGLQLPHPRMFERDFVTVPLRELLDRPRFQKPCWHDLRTRISRLSVGGGVRPFS